MMTKSRLYRLSLEKRPIDSRKLSSSFFVFSLFAFLLFPVALPAQNNTEKKYHLSLSEAIQLAKRQNQSVQAATIEEKAVDEDRKEVYKSALPIINAGSSYQRFSNLTLFTDGLTHSTSGSRKPSSNSANLGINVSFTIYGGGKQKALQNEQNSRLKLAKLNTLETSGNMAFRTASEYLELLRLNELQKFILDQLKRARVRVENITTLYKNQKVTKSDVLRSGVILSNVALSLLQNQNDIGIINQKLIVLMDLPDSVRVSPTDSAGISKPEINTLLPLIEKTESSSFNIQKTAEIIELQRTKVKIVQSSNRPDLSFFSAYGLNYPNYLFFPPVDQAYAIGFAGLQLHYNISSIYQNKNKLAAAKMRVKESELLQKENTHIILSEIKAYYIKYKESLNRISVNERSVEQAKVNYRIVNTKYLNQLALLTDLLDADNLYQESRLNLVKAQTDALTIYYHILYTSGNL